MQTVQIKLYDIFRKELNMSDDKAAELVSVVEEVVDQSIQKNAHALSTKEVVNLLGNDISKEIHLLELKIEQTKGDIYKAMFVSCIIQLLAILGGVLAIVKFMV